jgi:hypothetical protein
MFPPPPGTYIALLGAIAFLLVFWTPKNRWSKAVCLLVSLLLTGAEIHNLYDDRNERDRDQANARKEERQAFRSIAESFNSIAGRLNESITNNQQAFDATMDRMQSLADLTTANINEVTGGDSFCFVDMNTVPEGLSARVVQKGRYPVSNCRLYIADLNAAVKSPAALAASTRVFPKVDFLIRGSAQTLGVYRIDPKEEYVRYNVFLFARNGSFVELLRLHRLSGNRGWIQAMLVTASYDTGQKGIVLENIHRDFPMELLKTDQDWNNLRKGRAIKVAE